MLMCFGCVEFWIWNNVNKKNRRAISNLFRFEIVRRIHLKKQFLKLLLINALLSPMINPNADNISSSPITSRMIDFYHPLF